MHDAAHVKHFHALCAHPLHQLFRSLIIQNELDLYRQLSGKFEERILIQPAVPPEPRDGTECRTPVNTEGAGFFQQPLVHRFAGVSLLLTDVKDKQIHAALLKYSTI